MAIETELRFQLDAARARAILADPRVAAGLRRQPLSSIYFDTPDFALAARRAGLRVRRVGRRWVQTFKCELPDGPEHRRGEWEWPVASAQLDLDVLAETPLADWFAKPRNREALAPAFETRFTRASALVDHGETSIELAIDRGNVIAGERSEPILELELELKGGPVDGLYAFALDLNRAHALMPEPRSKAARGFMLSTGAKRAPMRAPKLQLEGEATAEQAFVSVMLNCLAQLQGNAAGARVGDDPEYVHQARVALRRMRSTLVTFRRAIPRSCSDAISIEARRLASALGAARDLDVFEEGTLAPLAAAGHATRLVAAFERLATLRQQARQQAAEALSAPGYTVFVLHLLRWIDSAPWRAAPVPASAPASAPAATAATAAAATPPGAVKPGPAKADPGRAVGDRTELRRQKAGIRRFAAGTLDRRHRAVIAIGGKPSGLDAEARHELRIAVKKLRYAAESFASLQGGKSEKAAGTYLAAMAWLQQSLGILNDMATGEALVAGGKGGPFDGAIDDAGLALLSGWRLGLCAAVLDDADRAWNRFREADRFW
jgi:inorganic triphosphatase YgiF